MKKCYTSPVWALPVFGLLFLAATAFNSANAQSFSQNNINFNGKGSLNNGTSLTFGPDGRLYVTEYTGSVKIFTIEREGEGVYTVTHMEELKGIQSIQGHNDDGTLHNSNMRETIGIAVTGTSANPVVYVSSSDFRIGGGGGGGSGDVGLDTNSGIITRYSWNGKSWDEVDIIRGLPRSEENHATNGMEFATINGTDYLIVAQGGHTNAGGPSTNFAYTTEYALSAAVLSVNLTMLNSMPVLDDNGRKYIYDLPTLDDPTRENKNGITDPDTPGYDGIDVNDPFGGNDGLNQAIIVPGGPVQIFSPGYRNTYDLVVTEGGAVYVTDNGSNGGWGGFPVNEGGELANNNYDPNEPGSSSASGGEQVNNKDHLSLVTLNMQEYIFGSFYGGHPTPVRANPMGAGLYTNPAVTGTNGAVFRTQIYDPDGSRPGSTTDPKVGLPANWPPVPYANPVEGDWRGPDMDNPDGPNDEVVTSWGTNTNGIDEYTASNFEGSMKGNLIAGVNTGELRRVELNPDGSLAKLTPSFASGIGGDALGVTCNSDNDIFPGTIWIATLNGLIVVLEPQDFVICVSPDEAGYDPLADNDFDGYTNQDEMDNGSDPCNGGSQPADFDKSAGGELVSDLNDPDDDNDTIPDAEDPFQMGDPNSEGSDAFDLPVINELFSSNPELKGYMGLGMTGMMNNGAPNPNWMNWLDRRDDPNDPNPNDILGGAIGAMTMHMTSGTALGTTNTQEKGFQYGVKVSEASGNFVVTGGIVNFHAPLQLYGDFAPASSELGFFIGDGTQSNYLKFVLTPAGLKAQQEINDIPQAPVELEIPFADRPQAGVTFYFEVDPSTGQVDLKYSFDNGVPLTLGTVMAQGAILEAIKTTGNDLAVGFTGTSNQQGMEVEGTWDYLHVTGTGPYITQKFPNLERQVNALPDAFDLNEYFDDDNGVENLTFSIFENTNNLISAQITGNILNLSYSSSPAVSSIGIRATDGDGKLVEQTFTITVSDAPLVLYRLNAGGPAITSIDGEVDWQGDTTLEISPYLSNAGSNNSSGFSMSGFTSDIDQTTTPVSIFDTERYDGESGLPNMTYSFPVSQAGVYVVRLYMGNGWSGTSSPGQRVFDVEIEGIIPPEMDNIDLSALFGHAIGGVITQNVEVNDGVLDISFSHGVENPLINGIEILGTSLISTPIQVTQVPDQSNLAGESLDGSLAVSATGGDGNLSYSMTGAPAGIIIEPTNGQIGGTIDENAAGESPYTVTVKVDDSDEQTNDAVSIIFKWYITTGEPVVAETLPNLERYTGAAQEKIILDDYFNDNGGIENLIYSVENQNNAIGATVLDNILTLTYPGDPAETTITIRATDIDANFVEQSFTVTVIPAPASIVLYRVNAGGPVITSIDHEVDWSADTGAANSPYLAEAGSNTTAAYPMTDYTAQVDQSTTPVTIFDTERYDATAGAPDMTYSFPVSQPGNYEVRIYMGNGYGGTSSPGDRIFDVAIEGIVHPEFNDIDLAGSYGHSVGSMIDYFVEVTDGSLDISFVHGAIENPLVNGIEILKAEGSSDIQVVQIEAQENLVGDVLDGSLVVNATGGDGDLFFSMTGAPAGVEINSGTGIISGTIAANADIASPYNVLITVDDSDEESTDKISTGFTWTVTSGMMVMWVDKDEDEDYTSRHECSFVQAGNNFYLMGGRENAKTVDIYDYTSNSWTSLEDSAPFEFNHYQATEYQGLIWIIGAFKTNSFPSEVPAEYVWAFDPASQEWIQGPEIPENRRRGSAGVVIHNDTFYIIGGNTKGHDGGYVAWFDKYDPVTGTWTPLADAPRARDHFHAAVIGDKLYAVGGRLSGGDGGTFKPVIAEVDVFDFTNGAWSTLPQSQNLPTPRGGASVVNHKNRLVVIGGEVNSENVHGTLTSDALKITEQFDPQSGVWTRIADLNFKRHGTQAIVSGEGIFTLAGSPNLGGGSQKNMEYMGEDNPQGEPLVSSDLSVVDQVHLSHLAEIELQVINGNVGVFIDSLRLSGAEAEDFRIVSGELRHAILKANSIHYLNIEYLGQAENAAAALEIYYGGWNSHTIALLANPGTPILVEPVVDQNSVSGEEITELAVLASGGDGTLVYSMTDAPPGVAIDSVRGIISGQIDIEADISSPYSVIISVDDNDEQTYDAVTTGFTWTVVSGEPVIAEEMPDLVRYINSSNENFLLSNYFNDNNGIENLTYSLESNTNTAIGAIVSEEILTLIYPSSPATTDITVRATDGEGRFVEQTFNVNVIYDPAGTPIEIMAMTSQENVSGDVLDGSLKAEATGGDGTLFYSISGAPAGVSIDPATGAISGTIAMDADVASPYNVSITVDDSDDQSADAVKAGFTWTVISGSPVISQALPDLERVISSVDETIDLNLYFYDNDGVENLTYTVEANINESIAASIADSFLTLSYPADPATTDITVRATDAGGKFVEQTFSVNVIYDPAGTSIVVTAIAEQESVVGAVLDGSFRVEATGGDGALKFAMNGGPAGVSIDAVTGVISGTIALDADDSSPYEVAITVDDSDDEVADAVIVNFTWIIITGVPVIAETLPDLQRIISSADEIIDLDLYFDDNDGVENLTYTVEANINESIVASIADNLLTLSYPADPATTNITVRATDVNGNFVEQTFTVDVIYDPAGTPISITAIAPQENYIEDILDGTLVVEATGGDGALVYSMAGAPSGVTINATTGVIGGTIAANADASSPYDVSITVDDSDTDPADVVIMNFTWTVLTGTPVITETLPDLERYVGAATETINLNSHFDDNGGVDMLVYSISANSNSAAIGIAVSGTELVINYPNAPATSMITVRATDAGGRFVEQTFAVNVIEIPLVLHRINAGGPGIPSIDAEKDWGADTAAENSAYLTEAGTNTVAGYSMTGYSSGVDLATTPTGIFASERSDETSGAPNMTYSLPVPKPGTYEVRLYFGNGHQGNSRPGRQIFDVELEGVIYPEFDNLDITALFGHQTGGVISRELNINDGAIDISFLHGAKKNPMINGIEIINVSAVSSPIQLAHIGDQNNVAGDVLNGSLFASATGGDGALVYSMTGAPAGVNINSSTGQISGTIDQSADMASPYNVMISVNDSDGTIDDVVQTGFNWLVTSGVPVVVLDIPDLQRFVNAEDEALLLSDYFNDNEGIENLGYTVTGNTSTLVGAAVSENMLTLSYPAEPVVTEITIRATDSDGKFVEQTFMVTVLQEATGSDIQVAQIIDQTGFAGEELDGSLTVQASGGDGVLNYSLSGAPLGVQIGSTSGVISGTIDPNAAAESPYEVTVSVDDSDEVSDDAVTLTFFWTVLEGIPVIVQELEDLERYTVDPDDVINLSAYFSDNEGVENLDFSVETNTDPSVTATVVGDVLTLTYPMLPAVSDITIRAADQYLNSVSQTFRVTVVEKPSSGSPILYRVNTGGAAIAAIDGEMAWGADTATEPSSHLTEAGTNTIGGYLMTSYSSDVDLSTTPTGIFSSERSDTGTGAPNMSYSFPVSEPGNYEIRLYFGSGHPGNSRAGRQIFDVEMEGAISPQLNDVDLAALFGHQVGGVIAQTLHITDGAIDIVFLHGPKKNPMINGIEIIRKPNTIQLQLTGGGFDQRSVEELNLAGPEPKVSLYPNPAVSEVYLELSKNTAEITEIYLYGYDGRLVQTYFAKRVEERTGLYKLDVSGLPEGTYLVRFNSYIGVDTPIRLVIKK